jgi:hypothetical protein
MTGMALARVWGVAKHPGARVSDWPVNTAAALIKLGFLVVRNK